MELAGNKCQLPLHRRTRACRPRLRWTMPPKGGTFWVGDAGGVAARARAGGEVAAERRSARQHSVRAEGGAKQRLTPPVWGLGSGRMEAPCLREEPWQRRKLAGSPGWAQGAQDGRASGSWLGLEQRRRQRAVLDSSESPGQGGLGGPWVLANGTERGWAERRGGGTATLRRGVEAPKGPVGALTL